ncbi:MAG: BamA/TamA family outer membrane protein [Proteobacteria bacterium]|nr:BamA/TamA family outer membrane protein [Pseudomonadota bacterium]
MSSTPPSRAPRGPLRGLAAAALLAVLLPAATQAGVEVNVSGVDDELRANIVAYLSFERYRKGGVELTADTVERLHNRVEREVQSALRPFGYYEPKVESSVSEHGHGNWSVDVHVEPGTPVRVQHIEVQVDGPGAGDPLFRRILEHLPLHEGERLNHASYEAIKTDLQRTAATYGYLDARMVRNELLVDPPQHTARIALRFTTGERYRFGKTTIRQGVVRESLVRRYLRYREGDLLDLNQVLRTQFALDDSQYFSNLQVLPSAPDRDKHIVPVEIRADPSRRYRYTIGAGYATDTGPRGTFGFEDHRINDRGHTFSVQVQASQNARYSLQSRYTIPIGDPAVDNLALRGSIEQRDWGDITTNTVSVGPSLTAVTNGWQHVWAVNAVHTSESADANGVQLPPHSADSLLVPELDLALVPKNYLGEALFEHPLSIEIKGSHSTLGSNSNWFQAHAQAERVFRLASKWHLLLRGEAGVTLVSGFQQLPTVFRFFAGGDNSVRGFGYDNLSPTERTLTCTVPQVPDPVTGQPYCPPPTLPANRSDNFVYVKVGGKNVITGTVEVIRELPRNLGVAAFFDYGNAFDRFPARLAYSVGIGLRVRLPVLTLGIDIAQPLYEPCQPPIIAGSCTPHSPRLHINFSPKL